jgi:antitoxin VapB
MPFHVRDPETDTLVRELAKKRGCGLTDAVKLAVRNELGRDGVQAKLAKIQAIQDEVARWPDSGQEADKAFFDWLSDDED